MTTPPDIEELVKLARGMCRAGSHAVADALEAQAARVKELEAAIKWTNEVSPPTNADGGGVIVHMTLDEFNAMRHAAGFRLARHGGKKYVTVTEEFASRISALEAQVAETEKNYAAAVEHAQMANAEYEKCVDENEQLEAQVEAFREALGKFLGARRHNILGEPAGWCISGRDSLNEAEARANALMAALKKTKANPIID